MKDDTKPTLTQIPPVFAAELAPRKQATRYPPELAVQVAGRVKRPLGDHFDIQAFGVNLTRIAPGAGSALLHAHTAQEEFVYVLEGEGVLVTEDGEAALRPGMCCGFRPGGPAHQLVNRGSVDLVVIEIGNRPAGDSARYPGDDLKAALGADGKYVYTRKDGRPLSE